MTKCPICGEGLPEGEKVLPCGHMTQAPMHSSPNHHEKPEVLSPDSGDDIGIRIPDVTRVDGTNRWAKRGCVWGFWLGIGVSIVGWFPEVQHRLSQGDIVTLFSLLVCGITIGMSFGIIGIGFGNMFQVFAGMLVSNSSMPQRILTETMDDGKTKEQEFEESSPTERHPNSARGNRNPESFSAHEP